MNNEKITAHQLWVDKLNQSLAKILWPKRIQNGKSAFMTSRSECHRVYEECLNIATHFENTRLRVVVDAMIAKLTNADENIKGFEQELQLRHWIRFTYRKKLKRNIQQWKDMRFAFSQAVLVLTNTPPPVEQVEEKPKMKVNR